MASPPPPPPLPSQIAEFNCKVCSGCYLPLLRFDFFWSLLLLLLLLLLKWWFRWIVCRR
jgi:hypothetical protein